MVIEKDSSGMTASLVGPEIISRLDNLLQNSAGAKTYHMLHIGQATASISNALAPATTRKQERTLLRLDVVTMAMTTIFALPLPILSTIGKVYLRKTFMQDHASRSCD